MNKIIFIVVAVCFSSIFLMNTTKANAQMVGADEENWNQVFMELKKLNSRLILLEKSTEEIKHALAPDSIGEVIDQINAQNDRLEDTNVLFRSELIPTIQKEITTNTTKVDLANEKLSRLIEILKAIVREQAKLYPLTTALNGIREGQKALQKDRNAVKQMLSDLRQKANVNISRNDDIRQYMTEIYKLLKR